MSAAAYCYILYNDKNNKTYNGYTTNIKRRIRQHNAIIKGGARATTIDVKKYNAHDNAHWKYLAVITSPILDKNTAMSLEWHIRYPTNKKLRPKEFMGPLGRLSSLNLVFQNPKFQDLIPTTTLYIDEKYKEQCNIEHTNVLSMDMLTQK